MLDQIVETKKTEVERLKKDKLVNTLKRMADEQRPPLNFAGALAGTKTKIIAEVKRASPSKGDLNPNLDPIEAARIYQLGGATAISVLTESSYFKGSIEHLAQIRKNVSVPLLRKDFIFDPYQIHEARAYGADAVLLIVSILEQNLLLELITLSHNLGLDCLIEVHDEIELKRAIDANARIIGINNRDLQTFEVDIETTKRLMPLVPQGVVTVSESGIGSSEDTKMLNKWRVNAALIGESLVTAEDPLRKLEELVR